MYLELKRKLGLNYSWVHIKRAQQHFDLKGDIIKINLNKFEKHYSNVTLISFPIILLMAIILCAYLDQKYKLNGILII